MIQGTGSDVGKSLLVAGLCARLHPARARGAAVQAAEHVEQRRGHRRRRRDRPGPGAAGARLRRRAVVDMNPVLLKPQADGAAQVVVRGQVRGTACGARVPRAGAGAAAGGAGRASRGSRRDADLVLVEGAGSPAEINLRAGDIANMGFAEAADVPVVLVGDIDRGGVIAQLVGTHAAARRRRARRGLPASSSTSSAATSRLFDGGLAAIERAHRACPASASCRGSPRPRSAAGGGRDGAARRHHATRSALAGPARSSSRSPSRGCRGSPISTISIRCAPSRRSSWSWCRPGQPLPRRRGARHPAGLEGDARRSRRAARARAGTSTSSRIVRRGGAVLGLCGGYQMLGRSIADPDGHRGAGRHAPPGSACSTSRRCSAAASRLGAGRAAPRSRSDAPVAGYEMHLGATTGPGSRGRCCALGGRPDGAVSADGRVAGCYLHGLFASDDFRRAFLARLGAAPSGARLRGARSKPRSTRSPTISSAASTSTRSSPPRGRRASPGRVRWPRQPGTEHQHREDHAGAEIEVAARGGCRCGVAIGVPSPSHGSSTGAPRIAARPGEREAERPGHRRLGPAGVGRAVLAGVAQHDAQRSRRRMLAGERRREREQQAGESAPAPGSPDRRAAPPPSRSRDSARSGGRSCCRAC